MTKAKWQYALIIPGLIAAGLLAHPMAASASDVDPRFDGNSDLGQVKNVNTIYTYQHGGNPDSAWFTWSDGSAVQFYYGGYWSGVSQVSFSYMATSWGKIKILAGGFSAGDYTGAVTADHSNINTWLGQSATKRGGGFADGNLVGPSSYQEWIEYGHGGDSILTMIDRIKGNPGLFYGSFHENKYGPSFQQGVAYASYLNGIPNDYDVSLGYDINGVPGYYPFSKISRFNDADSNGVQISKYHPEIINQIKIPSPKITYINNTTSAISLNPASIAPSGSYDIDSNHDSDRKMLSWTTGENNGKYFAIGDKFNIRVMSPIIQANGRNEGTGGSYATWTDPNGVTQQQDYCLSALIPDGLSASADTIKVYAIMSDGSRVDVTSKFTMRIPDDYNMYDPNQYIPEGYHRYTAMINGASMFDTSWGGYDNSETVGYSMITTVTVNNKAKNGDTYNIQGGSSIFGFKWKTSGTDQVHIYVPTPPSPSTSNEHAVVYQNGSSSDFSEYTNFYDPGNYANGKTFRSTESEGYSVSHYLNASPAVPDYVMNNKGIDSTNIDVWQTTQSMTFTIPYDNRYVTVTGGQVVRSADGAAMQVGTNGITGVDTGSSYIITVPASLLNVYKAQGSNWTASLKYTVRWGFAAGNGKVTTNASTVDEVSGTQSTNSVDVYYTTPQSYNSINTLAGDQSLATFGNANSNQVHFVNGQTYGHRIDFQGIGAMSGSTGVGQPIRNVHVTGTIAAGQVIDEVQLWRANALVWTGKPMSGTQFLQTDTQYSYAGKNRNDILQARYPYFLGTITDGMDSTKDHQVDFQLQGDVLTDKNFLYDTDDWHLTYKTHDADTSDTKTNTTSGYGDVGSHLSSDLTTVFSINGKDLKYEATLSQIASRVKPGAMLTKHDAWPSSANDSADGIRLDTSSVQAREVVDYRLTQFLGNTSTSTEAYPTPFVMTATLNGAVQVGGNIQVKAYDVYGNLTDVTNQFDISNQNGQVTASMKMDQNQPTGQLGSNYNKLYVLDVPLQNQQDDKVSTLQAAVTGTSSVNGQVINAPYINEFIPPETPMMYGYLATSAADSFDPKNPEKDQGRIFYQNSDGSSASAQISTAPIQWVIAEQFGDMSGNSSGQKYAYKKFTATFPDAALFKKNDTTTFSVYDETGRDWSSQFTGSVDGANGFIIKANDSFLNDMSKYGHKYYFVINETIQNSHSNRLAMASKAGFTSVYTAFRNLVSNMTAFFGHIGIGNTDKDVPTQNLFMQNDLNLLQINATPSNFNEKVSQLNEQPISSNAYTIQNVGLSRPTAGYTISGATAQYATDARPYESYRTTFSAAGGDGNQQVQANSVHIYDSITGQEVTNQYSIDIQKQNVSVTANSDALNRMQGYHKSILNQNAQDTVMFKVNTWGSRSSDSVVTWTANHNINGYDDARAVERVTIPQAHAGKIVTTVSPAGKNQWQGTDLQLTDLSEAVDLRLQITVPDDLHNQDFTDFVTHYIATEISPTVSQTPITATIQLGDNDNYLSGTAMQMITTSPEQRAMNDSRIVWQIPDSIVQSLNTTDAVTNSPTYTVIIHNVSYLPSAVHTKQQYLNFLKSDNTIKIPIGGFTTSVTGQQSGLDGTYFEGNWNPLTDSSIGSFGSDTNVGNHTNSLNIIMSRAAPSQDGYINGAKSNTSYTNKNN